MIPISRATLESASKELGSESLATVALYEAEKDGDVDYRFWLHFHVGLAMDDPDIQDSLYWLIID